jgi:hypothetical protein
MSTTAAIVKMVRDTFSMQNTPGGQRLLGMEYVLMFGLLRVMNV